MQDATQHTTKPKGRLAFTRRSAAIVVALLMIAAPAGASIIVQNYMEADISATPPCFDKVAGDDPTISTQVTFSENPLVDVETVDGVDLLEEKITVNGMTGDRVIYTDVVRYVNNCAEDIDVRLATTSVGGDWTDLAVEIWISNIEDPTDVDPGTDVPADEWADDFILVPAGTIPATYPGDQTDLVTVAPGDQIQGAFVVSSDVAFTAGTATVNWIASATID